MNRVPKIEDMGCGCKKKPVVTPTVQSTNTSVNKTAQQQDKLINEIITKVKQLNR